MAQAQAQAQSAPTPRRRRDVRLPGEDLTLDETLRVLDVARQLRRRRETAEEMFRRDDIRAQLKEKLIQAARVTGDRVTEAELDVAIDQYFESLHTYCKPKRGPKSFLGHLWVYRGRIAAAVTALAIASAAIVTAGMMLFASTSSSGF